MISLPEAFLRGSYTPLVTPFRSGALDLATYEQLVELQVIGGSSGIVVNGTTGEPSTLSISERNELVRTAVRCSNGRVPVVAATGSQSFEETEQLTLEAQKAGADCALIVTPYYSRPPQEGLVEYFSRLGNICDLPFLIYHIPGRAAVSITIESLEKIADRTPNLVGMKHAALDLGLVSEAMNRFGPEFRIFVGLEELSLPMMTIGAGGVMNAVGNLAPSTVAELCSSVHDGDLKKARELHYELFELNRAVFWDTNPIPIKYLMKVGGLLPENEHRLPMIPATPELEFRLDELALRSPLLARKPPLEA